MGAFYPAEALVQSDIRQNVCIVIFDETGIHGMFAQFEGEDPTYAYIKSDRWRNNAPYINHSQAGRRWVGAWLFSMRRKVW